ncbi:hypothetical protein ACFU8R_26430 [Pseudonocardia alni]|uniref:hypothetical protein n=1 Tax=Pseudonocardia alni TaxID=33907 RepID=UPI0036CE9AC1
MIDHGPEKDRPADGSRKLVACFDAVLPPLTLLAETQDSASTMTVLALVLILRVLAEML